MILIQLLLVICGAVFSAAASVNTADLNPKQMEDLPNDNQLALLLDNDAGRDRNRRSVLNNEDPLQVDEAGARKAERVKALQNVLYNNQYVRRRHRVRDKRHIVLIKERVGDEIKIVPHELKKREVKDAKPVDKTNDGNKKGMKNYLYNFWYSVIGCFKDWYNRLVK